METDSNANGSSNQYPTDDVKLAKAKLYNLKSAIDGLIPLVDQGVLPATTVKEAVSSLAARLYDEMTKSGY